MDPTPADLARPVGDTLHQVSTLDPLAQVVALVVLGAVVGLWIWTRRAPAGPGNETLTLVIGAMNEQSSATSHLAEQVERIVEQNAVLIAEMRSGPRRQA